MTFATDVRGWTEKVERNHRAIYLNVLSAIRDGIQHGSPVTGAPGQPVDTGRLIGSWDIVHEEQWVGLVHVDIDYDPFGVGTRLAYALAIEEGRQRPYTSPSGKTVTPKPISFRSAVGGAHSVAMTRTGFPALVDDVVRNTVG